MPRRINIQAIVTVRHRDSTLSPLSRAHAYYVMPDDGGDHQRGARNPSSAIKHKSLTRCWFYFGSVSQTVNKILYNTRSTTGKKVGVYGQFVFKKNVIIL